MHLKDGKTETYDLNNTSERKKFEDKYGKMYSVATDVNTSAYTIIAPVKVGTTTGSTLVALNPAVSVISDVAPVIRTDAINSTINGTTIISPAQVAPVISGTVTVIDDIRPVTAGEAELLITITRKTTPDQLEEYKKQMKEKGIELKYDDTRYDKGILTHISGSVKFKGGNGSFSGTDFNKLVLAIFKEGDDFYFKVRTVDKEVI
jgi:hypothetical protein